MRKYDYNMDVRGWSFYIRLFSFQECLSISVIICSQLFLNMVRCDTIYLMHSFSVNTMICQNENVISTETKRKWASLSRVDKS